MQHGSFSCLLLPQAKILGHELACGRGTWFRSRKETKTSHVCTLIFSSYGQTTRCINLIIHSFSFISRFLCTVSLTDCLRMHFDVRRTWLCWPRRRSGAFPTAWGPRKSRTDGLIYNKSGRRVMWKRGRTMVCPYWSFWKDARQMRGENPAVLLLRLKQVFQNLQGPTF